MKSNNLINPKITDNLFQDLEKEELGWVRLGEVWRKEAR
jgi:hypothetical protein